MKKPFVEHANKIFHAKLFNFVLRTLCFLLLRRGCYFQDGNKKLRLNMSVEDAYQRATNTLQKWIEKEVNAAKTLVVFRTYSPAHVRDVADGGRGGCAAQTLPELNASRIALHRWPGVLNPSFGEAPEKKKKKLHVLNVTMMTAQRRDGHPSVYNVAPPSIWTTTPPPPPADCSHWCLPGVPDAWNELLYALIVRRFS